MKSNSETSPYLLGRILHSSFLSYKSIKSSVVGERSWPSFCFLQSLPLSLSDHRCSSGLPILFTPHKQTRLSVTTYSTWKRVLSYLFPSTVNTTRGGRDLWLSESHLSSKPYHRPTLILATNVTQSITSSWNCRLLLRQRTDRLVSCRRLKATLSSILRYFGLLTCFKTLTAILILSPRSAVQHSSPTEFNDQNLCLVIAEPS